MGCPVPDSRFPIPQAVSRNSDVFAASVANAPVVNWITQRRYEGAGNAFNLISDVDHGQLYRALQTGPGGAVQTIRPY